MRAALLLAALPIFSTGCGRHHGAASVEVQQHVFVMTLPKQDDPTNCFPQSYVRVELNGCKVDFDAIRLHTDRKPWLSEGRVGFTVPDPTEHPGSGEISDVVVGKSGYLDETGTIAIPPRYENTDIFLRPFENGVASVRLELDGKSGYVDKAGKWAWEPMFECAYDFYKGVGAVLYDGKWGLVDSRGNWVVRPKYQRIVPVVGGLQFQTFDGEEGWLDPSGRETREP